MERHFFPTSADFREWLSANHDKVAELEVAFYKKGTGLPSITYREALDEALCFGWIDGVRRSLGAEAYTGRFTPRKAGSFWSPVNTKRAQELIAAGRMHAAGLAAFEARDEARTRQYALDREASALDEAMESRFRANPQAWSFFCAQPPSYRGPAIFWVTSAKREETRLRRLDLLIADCASGRRIDALTTPSRRAGTAAE
jgi:uncharacterized protein YdeI (YjbR/CyaY-like superfamily)